MSETLTVKEKFVKESLETAMTLALAGVCPQCESKARVIQYRIRGKLKCNQCGLIWRVR